MIKYPSIYRIWTKDVPETKRCLNNLECRELLSGNLVVEEKIDGGICGIGFDGKLPHVQGRGRVLAPSEDSKQFQGIYKWTYKHYESVQQIPPGWIVYGEWMLAKHGIYYDQLPAYFIAFDVFDGEKFLPYDEKKYFLSRLGFESVPLLYRGRLKKPDVADILALITKSNYSSSEIMEGVVIKDYDRGIMGKYVRREFMDTMDEHWTRKKLEQNRLLTNLIM